jgi:hypothetical protein
MYLRWLVLAQSDLLACGLRNSQQLIVIKAQRKLFHADIEGSYSHLDYCSSGNSALFSAATDMPQIMTAHVVKRTAKFTNRRAQAGLVITRSVPEVVTKRQLRLHWYQRTLH